MKKTLKKISACITLLIYVLTLLPMAVFAAEDTTTPVIYDAYISGNFVTGETLTANYSFDNPNVDTAKTNATIKWYSQDRYGNRGNLSAGDGTNSYTVVAADVVSNMRSIFFTVTPTDASGNAIGKTEYSNFGTAPSTKNSEKSTVPEALNAMIVPLNSEGTMMVGDTLAARFSYREVSGVAAGTHKYQWYTGTTMDSAQATAIENAAASTYTVQPEDSGKWIFVKITPVADNQAKTEGTAITTKIHLGNAARLGTASASVTGSFRGSTYSRIKFLADGSVPANHSNKGYGFILGNSAGAKTIIIDAGKLVPFNGYYISYGHSYAKKYTNVSISYSTDGTTYSTGDEAFTIADANSAEKELYFNDKVRYARYFKFEFTTAGETAIYDFYPFISNKALPKIALQGDEEVSLLASPDAPSYEDAGYIFSNKPDGYTLDEIKQNYISTEITDKEGNSAAEVVTTTKGEYNVTYTLAMPGLDKQSVTRKVVIGNGQKTPGNLAYYYEDDKNEVTYSNIVDKNSIEGAPAINDGNINTVCEITSDGGLNLPASAVIEVKDTEAAQTYVSQFVIKENGDNVTDFSLYVSSDGSDWGDAVYTGTSIGSEKTVNLLTPVRADYVKLEINSAADTVQLKEVEVFLDDDSKVFMAKEKILKEFENAVKALNHKDGYIYKNLPLVTEGIYGTKAVWTVSGVSSDVVYADNVNGELKIVRQSEETDFNLKLMVEFTDESKAGIFSEETLPQTLAKKSKPKAIDVHITGNFVMGQTLTIPDGYYYDEAGVPEDKSATQIKWHRANKWGSTTSSQGYLSANLPSTTNTYTIAVEDVYDTSTAKLLYNIYASITPASMADDDAKMGKASFTPLYEMPTTVSGDDAPTVSTQYISSLSQNGTMLAGDTVKVHYAYVNKGEVNEGATSYRWQSRSSLDSNPTILTSDSPLNKTYTLTEADFGKWIECVITPKSANGTKGTPVIARNHYGNAFLGDEAAAYDSTGFRGKPSINSIKVMAYQKNAYLYGSGSGADQGVYSDAVSGETKESYSAAGGDAGRLVPFNAFYVEIGAVAFNSLEFFYKVNADDEWTKLEITTTQSNLAAKGNAMFEIVGGAKLGRYFRMKTLTASGYAELYGFFPCITENAGAYMEFPEDLRITKGDSTFDADTAYTVSKDAVGSDAVPTVDGTVNVNKTGSYDVTYTIETAGDVWFPTYSVTKTFTVVDGIAAEGDEAFGADASTSNGTGASNLTDGNPNTSWTGEGTSADIIINLGSVTAVSEIKINEDTSNIATVDVYTSSNGTDWTLKADDAVLSDGSVTIPATEASYVKLGLTYSSSPTVSGVEVSADNTAKAQLAIAKLSLPASVSSDVALVSNGAYGTTISWLSTNPSVITTDGSVTRQTNDTVVTLTARVMDGDSVLATRSFHITVLKKENVNQNITAGGSSAGSFGVSGPAPAPAPAPSQPSYNYKNFADVPDTHWAAAYVNTLYENGIISGKGNGNYEPEAQITRAEFLKLIVEALKLTAENPKADFADVSENDWFFEYVAIGSTLGITKGANGLFNPNEPILRRDMAVMAKRALDSAALTLETANDVTLTDLHTVADYAKDAVQLLSSAGIINGNENAEFMPDKNATRAETAKIIYMILESIK